MTEYETIAPEISENITLIGNQQETKRKAKQSKAKRKKKAYVPR